RFQSLQERLSVTAMLRTRPKIAKLDLAIFLDEPYAADSGLVLRHYAAVALRRNPGAKLFDRLVRDPLRKRLGVVAMVGHAKLDDRAANDFDCGLGIRRNRGPDRTHFAFRMSRISSSRTSWRGGAGGGFSSSRFIRLISFTARKMTAATIRKSMPVWMNLPYLMVAPPTCTASPAKLSPPSSDPTTGITMSSTSEATILPNATPMITPTAR